MKNSEIITQYYNQYKYPHSKKFLNYIDKTPPIIAKRIEIILRKESEKKCIDIKNSIILDAGTSCGWTYIHWAENFNNIIGADCDFINALKITKKRLKNPRKLIVCDFKYLPFKNEVFEIIISNTTVEHIDNPKMMIEEFHRIIKKNGFLYYFTANKLWIIEPHYNLFFLSYLPKKLANLYLKFFGLKVSYNDINLPTYSQFRNIIIEHFNFYDLTFDLLNKPNEYNLIEERGKLVIFVSFIFHLLGRKIYAVLKYISMGWVFICTPKEKK